MALKELWDDFKNMLRIKREEPVTFGVKNVQFRLQSNDGFEISVDRQTAFQCLRLKAFIAEKGFEDPLSRNFGEPIVLSGIEHGKALELVIKWTSQFMNDDTIHDNPMFLLNRKGNYDVLGALTGKELLELREAADYLDIPLVLKFLLEVIKFIEVHYAVTEEVIRRTESIERWIISVYIDAYVKENE